jgi:hypothetical protein
MTPPWLTVPVCECMESQGQIEFSTELIESFASGGQACEHDFDPITNVCILNVGVMCEWPHKKVYFLCT